LIALNFMKPQEEYAALIVSAAAIATILTLIAGAFVILLTL